MHYVRKSIFVIPYLAFLIGFVYFLNPLLTSLDVLFAFNIQTIVQIILMIVMLLLASVFYVIFVTLADDMKLVLPLALFCSIIPALVLKNPYALYFSVGLFLAQAIIFASLKQKLSSYLTFSASSLLSSSVRHFATLVLLVASVVFFFSVSATIQQNGFKLPDQLVDLSVKLATQQNIGQNPGEEITTPIPQLSADQIQLLKKHPELLQRYGLTPAALDKIAADTSQGASSTTSELIKPLLEQQFQTMIQPFEKWIAPALAVFFFLTLLSIVSLLTLSISPLLWAVFWVLEKTKFANFVTEMREVKKLVV